MTQYERNSLSIAVTSYRRRKRQSRLFGSLAVFFSMITIICALLYIIISSVPCR
ncbi:MAG: hypothetical protein HFE52_02805 [Clostridia bacterium]|nr:hypothetical protein [Clostridia bacterium]MCI8979579.1 hypothetical protein [Clostridia bacterium]